MFWNIVNLIVGLATLLGVYFTWKGIDDLRKDSDAKRRWSRKHTEAAQLVLKSNKWISSNVSRSQTNGYGLVFPRDLRPAIETYIVHPETSSTKMTVRVLDPEQFSLPIVQETIQKTIDAVDKFKHDNPEDTKQLEL